MKKLKPIGLIVIFCLIGLGIALGARIGGADIVSVSNERMARPRTESAALPVSTPRNGDPQPSPSSVMSEPVKFKFLFEHLDNIRDKPGVLRRYQQRLGLTDGALYHLIQLTMAHKQDASVIDGQIKIIVDNFHAQYPRNLPPGVVPPSPPQELLNLETQRDALALRYRDQFRARIGEEAFTRFKQLMDVEFTPRLSNAPAVAKPSGPVPPQKEAK